MLARYTDLLTIKVLPYEEQLFVANGRLAPDGLILAEIDPQCTIDRRYLYYSQKLLTLSLNERPFLAVIGRGPNKWYTPLNVMKELLGKTHNRLYGGKRCWE